MPKLILKFKDKTISSHFLVNGATITIGRHGSNNIVVDNQVVSGLHAHVDLHGEEITITDLESKNGTYHNGERISKAVLHHNDMVTIGKHTIVLDTHDGSDEEQTDKGQ
jgi:pSer/pThr/pTyr-binding forkhead associated (FHA) protein